MGRQLTTGYTNEEIPDRIPPQNQGAIPVIVRLVDDEHGEHYRAAEARRWTDTHVMVAIPRTDPETGRRRDRLAWLRAEDVKRVLTYAPSDQARRNPWLGRTTSTTRASTSTT
jgi:hypothetical protein